jgi:tetratricopeptide (TPR) repeat protein
MMAGTRWGMLCGAMLCVTLAACTSKAQRIESGLRKGAQFLAQSDWDHASVEARNVLQMDPKNVDAFLIAARIEDGKGAFRNAYANYSKVLELRPDSVEAQLGECRLYLLAGDLKQAEISLSALLANHADDARVQTLQTALLARHGQKDQALALADRIAQSGQTLPVDSALVLAGLFYNANRAEAALDILDKTIAGHQNQPRLLQMAAEVAQSGKPDGVRIARAAGYYTQATAANPKDTDLWRSWASMYLRANDQAHAEGVLRKAIDAEPDDASRTIALLRFKQSFGDKVQTEKDFAAAIEAHPRATELRFAQADFYRGLNRPDDAVRVLLSIIDAGKATPPAASARGLLATIWMEQGKSEQASGVLAELLKNNPRDSTGLVLRGRLELANGDVRAAVADLRSAAKDKPGSLEITDLLAHAHHLIDEPELAREVLADAVKFNDSEPRAHLLLAADMAQTKEFPVAMSEIDAAIKADPKSIAAYQMKIDVALVTNDLAGAEAVAAKMETLFPSDPRGHMAHGRALAAQKKFGPALAQYDAAAKVAPEASEPRITAVALLTAQRKFGEASARIDALQKANPNSALAREMRGEVALAVGDLAKAQDQFQQLVAMPGAPASAYKTLAAVLVARQSLPEAMTVLDQGEKAWPADVTLASARAEWLGRAGRTDEAIAVYEKLLQRSPNSDVAANNLAYVLVQSKHDKPSLDRALQLANRFSASTQPLYVDTLGLVEYRLGRFGDAAAVLGRAASLAPDNAAVQLHYGMALYRKGDVQQGTELVRKALAGKAPLPDRNEAQALIASS